MSQWIGYEPGARDWVNDFVSPPPTSNLNEPSSAETVWGTLSRRQYESAPGRGSDRSAKVARAQGLGGEGEGLHALGYQVDRSFVALETAPDEEGGG